MYGAIGMALSAAIAFTLSVEYISRQTNMLGSISHNPQRPIIDFDDGGGRSFEEDKPRIDRFAKAIKEDGSAEAYIIAYGGLVSYKNEPKIRLNCIRKYLATTHKISRSRIKLIDGGYAVEVMVQLYLVKPDDPDKPAPVPFVNREAVRMKKAPKYPCGKGTEN